MFVRLCLILALLFPIAAHAQEDERGFIAGLLEDSLGGPDRTVRINGFSGAFSSEARINQITIADPDGIWLTIDDVILQWNRSALLRGRIEIDQLKAARIDLARLPDAPEDEMPSAEAQGFALPDLPVSIDIGEIAAETITLGAPVLGEAAALRLHASASLGGGAAELTLKAERIDDKQGAFDISGSFEDSSQMLTLNTALSEEAGGIVARLAALPGQPSVALNVDGSGPLDAFEARLNLATDGQPRLSGTVTLGTTETPQPGIVPARSFSADLGGDVTALFAPQYRDFFGEDITLSVRGERSGDGALTLDQLALDTQALSLEGRVTLNRENWPVLLDITGTLGAEDGSPVLLPIPGDMTRVERADIALALDQSKGDGWTGRFNATGFERPGLSISELSLAATGTLDGRIGQLGALTSEIDLDVAGLTLSDAAQQEAVGDALRGTLSLAYTEGQPVRITDMALSGADYGLAGDIEIGGLDAALETLFDLALSAQDLSRFSGLSGQNLTGAAELGLQGRADLGGAFNIDIDGQATGLSTGIAQTDALLAGQTRLSAKAIRNETGTTLRGLDLRNDQLNLTGALRLATDASKASFDARITDSAALAPQLEGPLSVTGIAAQEPAGWQIDIDAAGPFDSSAEVEGLATGPEAALEFLLNLPDIAPLVPGQSGAMQLDGTLSQSPEGWQIASSVAGPYELSAEVAGRVTGQNAPEISFDANLPDIRPLAPQFSGPVRLNGTAQMGSEGLGIDTELAGPYGLRADASGRVTGPSPEIAFNAALPNAAPIIPALPGAVSLVGTARQVEAGWQIETGFQGPSGAQATIGGLVATDGQLALGATGTAPLALANPFIAPRSLQGQAAFDLRIDGPASLTAVSGRVTTSGARLSAPTLRVALNELNSTINLSGGRAEIEARSAVSSGGQIALRGPVTLNGAFPAQLSATLQGVRVVDPSLYETVLDGVVTVDGGLTGGARIAGRIDVGETNISVPSSGLGGFTIVPDITHLGASQKVRATQSRAGLTRKAEQSASTGPAYPFDLTVSAPARVFVRGRGLDAELGGQLRLTGTTANLISSGRAELIRGRLDILEKRFNLDEGSIQLQGNFDPFLRFVATTQTNAGTASVIIEGAASAPEVRFEASPPAPQDEVLAQIFFGRDVSQLSAFQALQLANAVATLAGQGGGGIISNLRRSFDLDDLDVTTDADGNTALRLGKYISDNVYTDVELGGADGAEVSINIDLTPSLTARGSATSTGETALGIFFERDY